MDLDWFRAKLERNVVGEVMREELIKVFASGRVEGLAQATINRRVMVGLMALRNTGVKTWERETMQLECSP